MQLGGLQLDAAAAGEHVGLLSQRKGGLSNARSAMPQSLIETSNLRKVFGERVALAGLDLAVGAGETVGLLGPNGAGKSTALKMLTTLVTHTSGTARVAGFDVAREPMEVKRRIGYVPESAPLFEALSGVEYLTMVADLKLLEQRSSRGRIVELAEDFGLGDVLEKRIGTYSKGMRQKVAIIAALLGDPDVLILDEPMDGLDPLAGALFKELLRMYASERKATLLCSHSLEVVEQVCDRIYILAEGRLVADGTAARISRDAGATDLEGAFLRLTDASAKEVLAR